MRLNSLILTLGILLCCPSLLLSQDKEAKRRIILEEWLNNITKPQACLSKEPVVNNQETKPPRQEESLPAVFQKRLTLRSLDVGLKTVLNKIAQITGFNLIADPEVDLKVNVSVDAMDVPVWQALNDILFPLSYGFKVKDKDLIILSKETRTFKITLPPNVQDFSDTISNESWTKSDDTNSSNSISSGVNSNMNIKVGARLFVESKASDISFWKDIEANLAKMLSAQGRYSFNKLAGIVVVTDNPVVLEKVSKYLELVNQEAQKQILVEVKILEVTLSNKAAFGIDWNTIYKNLGGLNQLALSSNFALENIVSPGLFTLTAAGPKDGSGTSQEGISALIKALEEQGRVEVISQPKVMLLNNQSAMVQVGTVTNYVANTTTTTTQAGLASTSATTDQVQEGVSLRLMASILDNEVLVQLTPVVTTLDEIRSINMGGGTTIEAPKTSTKSMHTLVKIKDGSTIAVGGLITSNDNKTEKGIPVLRKLPLLGRLFEYRSKSSDRTELVIFLTPKIITQ